MLSLISANFIVFLSVASLLHTKLVFAWEWEHFEAILWNTLSELQGKKMTSKFAAVSGFLCDECSVTAAVQGHNKVDILLYTCIYLFVYLFIYLV